MDQSCQIVSLRQRFVRMPLEVAEHAVEQPPSVVLFVLEFRDWFLQPLVRLLKARSAFEQNDRVSLKPNADLQLSGNGKIGMRRTERSQKALGVRALYIGQI